MSKKTEKIEKDIHKNIQGKEKKQSIIPQYEYNDYLIFLHKKRVRVVLDNGMSFEGILRSKAKFDIQLILNPEEKKIITINKSHIVFVEPIE